MLVIEIGKWFECRFKHDEFETGWRVWIKLENKSTVIQGILQIYVAIIKCFKINVILLLVTGFGSRGNFFEFLEYQVRGVFAES